jgi:hypothetical protein
MRLEGEKRKALFRIKGKKLNADKLLKQGRGSQNEFSISVQLTSNLTDSTWILTNVYGPSQTERKSEFIEWFTNIDMLIIWIG